MIPLTWSGCNSQKSVIRHKRNTRKTFVNDVISTVSFIGNMLAEHVEEMRCNVVVKTQRNVNQGQVVQLNPTIENMPEYEEGMRCNVDMKPQRNV